MHISLQRVTDVQQRAQVGRSTDIKKKEDALRLPTQSLTAISGSWAADRSLLSAGDTRMRCIGCIALCAICCVLLPEVQSFLVVNPVSRLAPTSQQAMARSLGYVRRSNTALRVMEPYREEFGGDRLAFKPQDIELLKVHYRRVFALWW